MNKAAFIQTVARKTGKSSAEVRPLVDAMLEAMQESVAQDGKVTLPGFGTFLAKDVAAGMRTNPSTGEQFHAPATRRVAFRPSNNFKELVSGKQAPAQQEQE